MEVLQDHNVTDVQQKENLVQEIEKEIGRRKNIGADALKRRQVIEKSYKRLHPNIFQLKKEFLAPEFMKLVDYCKLEEATFEDVFGFIKETQKEIQHFESSSSPKGRPNTMNKYGVLLDELGFDGFITDLRDQYLQPVTQTLFQDWGGGKLDSHKAFIVQYKQDEDLDLSYHYDNAEVTINVALSPPGSFTGGNLYFGAMRTDTDNNSGITEHEHVPTVGILHRGQHKHGARPIASGERYNLIIWMRASSIRNRLCPMCDNKPDLVETVGFGDGFTVDETKNVDVCTLH